MWNGDSTSCRMDARSSEFVREKFVHVEREDNDSCTSTILSLAILIKAFGSIPADLVWLSHPQQHTPPILLLLRSSVPVRSCWEVLSIFSGRPPCVVVDVIKKSVGASECEAEGGGKFKSR